MNNDQANEILEKILEAIDLPDSAYERAKERYESIGKWLQRDESSCAHHDPHVFPSGSFRLGLANKPVDENDTYDLDMACELQNGITQDSHTQEDLKKLIGDELELYRKTKGILKVLNEKRRCWTLEYADHLNFHMDIVPCIPESVSKRTHLREAMILNSRLDKDLAREVASLAVSITDNKDVNFKKLSSDWQISNPEGFGKWFESRMRVAQKFLASRQLVVQASIDTLPYYRWKTPLQQAIQILKQHRDEKYKNNPDSKPISVIITTVAARAYQGEDDLASALMRILRDMDSYINSQSPLVPNPVNPKEDFADKWSSPDHTKYKLKENFYLWLEQAQADFKNILEGDNPQRIVEAAKIGLSINLNQAEVAALIGTGIATAAPVQKIKASSSPRPWAEKP